MHRRPSRSVGWRACPLGMSMLALALAGCVSAQPSRPAPSPSPTLAPAAASAPAATPAPATPAPPGAAQQIAPTSAGSPPGQPSAESTVRLPPPKEQRSAAQRKIDSNLLAQIQPPFDAAAPLLVDISARVSDALLERMRARGAEIVATDTPSNSVRARLPAGEIEPLAADADVIFIMLAQMPATH